MRTSLIAGAVLLTIFGSAAAVTIHVPGEQPTIQAGITAASDGDTVLVACDTYYEHGLTMKSGVTLLSETGDPSCVTIDCSGSADQAFYIIGVHSCLIAGFTVTGGDTWYGGGVYGDGSFLTFQDCWFTYNTATESGGGIHWDDGAVTLIGCTFTGNTAVNAGGGLHANYSDATVTDCTFDGNGAAYGGGLAFEGGASLTVTGSAFSGNTANAPSDGGGGAYVENCEAAFTDCGFDGNDGGNCGGGIYTYDSVLLTCTGCTLTGNEADFGGGILTEDAAWTMLQGCDFISNTAIDGGGVYFYHDAGAAVQECTFTGNAVREGGGGVTVDGSVGDVVDCTFDDNEGLFGAALAGYYSTTIDVTGSTFVLNRPTGGARSNGTVYMCWASLASIENSIIAFNSADEAVVCEVGGTADLLCSLVYGNAGGDWTGCIEGQETTVGNWHVDPRFCGLLAGDYSLCANSVCLPENNPCLVRLGAFGEGCGDCDTPVERMSWGAIKAEWR